MTIWMDVDAALSEVPVNVAPLTDDTDFKTLETAVAYNASGLALWWHFLTPAGAYTVTQVTPTTGGNYDWAHQTQGMYTIEIPASGGASINNDTEGFGYFTGVATGVLPWRGPTIGFRAAGLNDALVESAWDAIRGLAGTALPNVVAGAAGSVNDATRIGGTTQTAGDIFARLGAPAGASISADIAAAKAILDNLNTRLTSARAGYLDNLNVGGAVASNADVLALNQSASRRIILTTVPQFERPESGSTVYTIEARTYDGDGAAVNADSTPTLTVTGQTTGSLAANLSSATNPATGLYRWSYTVQSDATLEPIRADVSAVIGASTFTLAVYSQIVDFVAATFSTTDRANLEAILEDTGTTLPTAIGTRASQTSVDGIETKVDTLLSRITSTLFSGITSVGRWLGAIAGKTADTVTRAEINATTAGATFNEMTDSLEAVRDRGDAAWTTGSGGGGGGGSVVVESLEAEALTQIRNAVEGATITLTGPMSQKGKHLKIVRGDDYAAGNGRSITFTIEDAPGLVGSVAVLRLNGLEADACVSPEITLATQTVVMGDLLAATTILLTESPQPQPYQIRFTKSGLVATTIDGMMLVKDPV